MDIRKYVFVDIDGVLNTPKTHSINLNRYQSTAGIEKKRLILLKEIVDKTKAGIVLISDWRFSFLEKDNLPKMAKYITKKFNEVDLTFELVSWQKKYLSRGDAIRRYIAENPCNGFVIIDDIEYPEYYDDDLFWHYIRINNKRGLEEDEVRMAIKILNSKEGVYYGTKG